jgi:Na+/serine symporter
MGKFFFSFAGGWICCGWSGVAGGSLFLAKHAKKN